MLGEAARKHPELVKQVAEAKHAIGNHSDSHLSFQQIGRRKRRKQLLECKKAIAPYGSRLFRPPHGHQSIASRFDALMLRYKVVTWNVAVQDWASQDADWLAGQLGDQIQPGSIILLHDALRIAVDERYKNRNPMLEALDRFLEKSNGQYSFVTLPELFKRGRPVKENWYRGISPHGVYETE
jgi:peptidoglycan/xylan/chitin deacetylase (PgdA/CDA1 family)